MGVVRFPGPRQRMRARICVSQVTCLRSCESSLAEAAWVPRRGISKDLLNVFALAAATGRGALRCGCSAVVSPPNTCYSYEGKPQAVPAIRKGRCDWDGRTAGARQSREPVWRSLRKQMLVAPPQPSSTLRSTVLADVIWNLAAAVGRSGIFLVPEEETKAHAG